MPVKVFSNRGSNSENQQLTQLIDQFISADEMLGDKWTVIIQSLDFKVKKGNGYQRAEIDALIIRENAMILVDFKDYSTCTSISMSKDDVWLATDRNGNHVEVKGGSQKNPFSQALRTRYLFLEKLKRDHCEFYSNYIQGAWSRKDKKSGKTVEGNRLASIVAFTADLELTGEQITAPWFNISKGNRLFDCVLNMHDKNINLAPFAIGVLVSEFGFKHEHPLAKELSGEYKSPALPGFISQNAGSKQEKSDEKNTKETVTDNAEEIEPSVQYKALADAKIKHKNQAHALVYFPTVSKNRAVLNNARVTVLPEIFKNTKFMCNAANRRLLDEISIESFIAPARSYELTPPPTGIEIVFPDSNFSDKSFQLSVAIADQLARYPLLIGENERIMATGTVGENGVNEIEYITEKALLLLEKANEKHISWFVFPKNNEIDLKQDVKERLINRGIKLIAIKEIEELDGVLWDSESGETFIIKGVDVLQAESVSLQIPPKKRSLQLQFFSVGLVVLSVIALAAFVNNNSFTTEISIQAQPQQKVQPMVSQLDNSARYFQRDQSDWSRLSQLLNLYKKVKESDIQAITPETQQIIDSALHLLNKSDQKLTNLSLLLKKHEVTDVQQWKSILGFDKQLSKLDLRRLKQDSPEIVSELNEKVQAYQRFALAERISSSGSLAKQGNSNKKWLMLSVKEQSLFKQEYPNKYQILLDYQKQLKQSNQRLANVKKASKNYVNNRYSDKPENKYWNSLINSVNTLQEFDKQRADNSINQAIVYARLAKVELEQSNFRINNMVRTTKKYVYAKNKTALWPEMSNKANLIKPLDIARMNKLQAEYYEFALNNKESSERFKQKYQTSGIKIIME